VTITLDGGMIFWGKEKTDTVDIAAGDTFNFKSFVIGFGSTTIEVTVDTTTETASGKVLLFFVLGVT
jgi:hypothetical protein